MGKIKKYSIFVLATLLVSCASVTTTHDEALGAAKANVPNTPDQWAMADARIGLVDSGWVARYDDPILLGLVREAQQNNRDLRALATRIDQAWALADRAGAGRAFQLSGTAGTSGNGNLDGFSTGQETIGLRASWEADIWGRLKAGEAGSIASAQAIEADVQFSRLSLAFSVANAYFTAVEAGQQIKLAKNNIADLTQIEHITSLRYENGIVSLQDAALARSNLASAKANLARLNSAQRDALRSLEVLLGRYPLAEVKTAQSLSSPPPNLPAGLPSQLLERRPDLIAAERRIAASMDFVNQAKAAKLPSIGLTGSAGGASDDLSNILNPANILWSAAADLLVPIFDGGALDADIASATADQQQAIDDYAQTALNAFQDTETALDATKSLREQRVNTQSAVSEAEQALHAMRLRYDNGISDLIDVLNVQSQVNSLRSSLLSVKREQLVNYGALNLALGGDWENVSTTP